MFKAPLLEEAYKISQMDEFYDIEPSLRVSLRDSPGLSNKDGNSQLERYQLNSMYAPPATTSPLDARSKVQKRTANRQS
jgi:hypothetical protein